MRHRVVAIDGGIVNVGVCVLSNFEATHTQKTAIAPSEPKTSADVCKCAGEWVAENVDKLGILSPHTRLVIESVQRPKIQAVGLSLAGAVAAMAQLRGVDCPPIRFMHGVTKFGITPECRLAAKRLKGKKNYNKRKILAQNAAISLCETQGWAVPKTRDECDAVLLAAREWQTTWKVSLPEENE